VGVSMSNKIDLVGQIFGRWTVLSRSEEKKTYEQSALWKCLCECGNQALVSTGTLRRGKSKSCGCLQRESATKHGMYNTRVYKSWQQMRDRCNNPNHHAYSSYGGRGISVCKEWGDFEKFYEDMGDRPENMSIDRIDNDKGYSSNNCQWSTPREQVNNRRCSSGSS